MTEEPKRTLVEPPRKLRHHEVDIERPAHPGEPRRVVSSDHEDCLREPAPALRRGRRGQRSAHAA